MSQEPSLIPQGVLFGSTETTAAAISPDGRRIAYVGPIDEVANLFVRDLDGTGDRALTNDTERGIREFRWTADGGHLLYQQDVGGDENWQLFLCDVETGQRRPLVALEGVKAQVVGVAPHLEDTVCVALNQRDPRWHDLYHVSVSTGELTQVAENPGFTRWVVDAELQARGGVRPLDDGSAEIAVRDGADWRTLLTLDAEDSFQVLFDVFPMRFSADGKALYLVTSHGRDTTALMRLDVATGDLDVVAAHDEGDVMFVHFHPQTHEPQLVIAPAERNQYLVCDPDVKSDVEALRAAHRGDFNLLSRSADDRLWTVEFTLDAGSRAYYLYDRDAGSVELLFHAQPELETYDLAEMEPFTYTARDGLKVHGYLTFPPGAERHDLPTVVLVHGGPANRYFWGYHALVQLLANRGYLVVQVNFRGSVGYGKAFLAAGNGEWGRAMHHDIVDCIDWVTEQGYADRARVGLWGTSYGGYEVLFSVTNDPDLVSCAVGLVAPVNLVTLLRSIPPYWRAERAYFAKALGDLETDEETLWERSPLRLADRIKVPLLLFYGERDPRVPVSEAKQIAEALEDNAIPHELHIIPDEGHSLGAAMSPDHRAWYVETLERFLAEHLGGRQAADTQQAPTG